MSSRAALELSPKTQIRHIQRWVPTPAAHVEIWRMTTRALVHARWVVLGPLVLLPGAAAAQATDSPPRVAIGAGAGVAFPLHGDFDFTPWAWDADVRWSFG